MKSKVDKLDIGKLEAIPDVISKLSNVVKDDVAKNLNMMNWLKKLIMLVLLILAI